MKKTFIIILAVIITIFFSVNHLFAQKKKKTEVFKKDCVMLYEVEFNDNYYLFNVRVNELSSKGLKFDWFMTNNPGMTGKVSVNAASLQSATAYLDFFSFRTDYNLTDKSCVWMSRDVFQKLKKGEMVSLDLDGGLIVNFKMSQDNRQFIVPVSSRYDEISYFNVIRIDSDDGKYFMYVLNEPENPVILYMDLKVWYVKLIGVM